MISLRHDRAVNDLTGLFVPLITPFTADGSVAPAALEGLAHRVLGDGATGIVALGTTAETPTLTAAEQAEVVRICSRVCGDHDAPLIVGAGSNNTASSVAALAQLAHNPEVRAALTVVPYYSRPGPAGVLEHFRTLAAASSVPVLVYNIPYRTGQAVGWPVLRELAAMAGIAGVKHSTGSIDADTIAMMAERPARFSVLGGDCLCLSPLLALGADGAISAAAHVCTGGFARLIELWRDGQAAEARQLGHQLAPLSRALFAEPNPTVIKALLYRLGEIPSPAVRLPLLAAGPESTEAALQAAERSYAALAVDGRG
jgi:4-hydroxy-tetrahydrodipicolinate synthase